MGGGVQGGGGHGLELGQQCSVHVDVHSQGSSPIVVPSTIDINGLPRLQSHCYGLGRAEWFIRWRGLPRVQALVDEGQGIRGTTWLGRDGLGRVQGWASGRCEIRGCWQAAWCPWLVGEGTLCQCTSGWDNIRLDTGYNLILVWVHHGIPPAHCHRSVHLPMALVRVPQIDSLFRGGIVHGPNSGSSCEILLIPRSKGWEGDLVETLVPETPCPVGNGNRLVGPYQVGAIII